MTPSFRLTALAVAVLFVSGCASVVRGSKDDFHVVTEPAGARVTFSNGFVCETTPCTLKMHRGAEFFALIEKRGYHTETVMVKSEMTWKGGAALLGNAASGFGGIVGGAVDLGNSATNDLTPNPLMVTLRENENAAPGGAVTPVSLDATAASTAPAGPQPPALLRVDPTPVRDAAYDEAVRNSAPRPSVAPIEAAARF